VVLIAGTLAMAAFAVPGFAFASRSVVGLLVSDVVMGAHRVAGGGRLRRRALSDRCWR
jgi:hypothetical protein